MTYQKTLLTRRTPPRQFHDPIQLLFNISNVILVLCIPLRLLALRAVEELVLTVAVVGSWFHLMFFAG